MEKKDVVKKELKDLTLGEIQEICRKHLKEHRDCEACKIFSFCNYQMTTGYPDGWKL